MRTAQGTAQGKLLLFGEHSVVYGHPAVAAGVSLYLTVSVSHDAQEPGLTLEVVAPELGRIAPAVKRCRLADVSTASSAHVGRHDESTTTDAADPEVGPLLEALEALMILPQLANPPGRYTFEICSALPVGRGLGSSTAVGIAALRAVLALDGRLLDDAALLACAQVVDRVFHGRPSGVDAAAILHGGLICYRVGNPPRVQDIFCSHPLNAVLMDSGNCGATGVQVARVAASREADPRKVNALLEHMGRLATQAISAIGVGDRVEIGQLMNENHACLRQLGVSTPALDYLVALARDHGALGAKLTGAGGGGCVVALAGGPNEAATLAAAVAGMGHWCRVIELGPRSPGSTL